MIGSRLLALNTKKNKHQSATRHRIYNHLKYNGEKVTVCSDAGAGYLKLNPLQPNKKKIRAAARPGGFYRPESRPRTNSIMLKKKTRNHKS